MQLLNLLQCFQACHSFEPDKLPAKLTKAIARVGGHWYLSRSTNPTRSCTPILKDLESSQRNNIDDYPASPNSFATTLTMLHSPTLLAGLTICIALKAYRIISTDAAKTTCQVLAIAVYGFSD